MSPAKKSLSQNFLVDPNLQRKIVKALDPASGDRVLEIGPGTGALTQHLVGRVAHLTLIELDDELTLQLREIYGERDDVEIVHADVLDVPLDQLAVGAAPLKVIGNIPYGITSPLIFHLLDRRPRPALIVLTVQREVARRLSAQPASKDFSALTVGVQAVAQVERLFNISRRAFRPTPDVDSSVVRLTPFRPAALSEAHERALRRLTRAAFSRRRKQLQNVLRQAPEFALSPQRAEEILTQLQIDPAIRPDALSVERFVQLAAALAPAP